MSRRRARLEWQEEEEAATLDSRGRRTRGFKFPEIALEVVIATACDAAWRDRAVRESIDAWLRRRARAAARRSFRVTMPGGEELVAVFVREVRTLAGLEVLVAADASRPRNVYHSRRLP